MTHPEESRQPNWIPALTAITLVLAWIGYWYWGSLEAMAQIWWRSETYAHGLVVPPISLWLIWRERHRLAVFQPQPTFKFTLPLACFVFCWLLGELTAVNALTQFSVIGIVILALMSLVGLSISKELLFPFLFLFFAVPVGDFLLPQLMEWTADFTVLALRLSGVPVFREGQSFVIPSGNWSVVEACSGIRYLIASLTVGALYAYLTYTSLKRRLAFFLVALFVPIIANWLRAYLIVMLGHISGNKLASGVDHLIYGWIFFGIVIAIMFAIGMRWAEPGQPDLPKKVHAYFGPPKQEAETVWQCSLILALIIAAGPIYVSHIRQLGTESLVQFSLPEPNSSWRAEPPLIDWKPQYINPYVERHSAYSSQNGWVGLYIAYYRNQSYDSKLVSSTNVLAASKDTSWSVVKRGQTTASFAGKTLRVREAELLQKQGILGNEFIVWQWYWVNGHLTSSDIDAKWLTALAMLTGHGDDCATIIIYARKSEAADILPSFANQMGAEILQHLAKASQR
jgi:exosortase A